MRKIQVGDKASFKRTITQQMVDDFARLTGDENTLHTSKDYAKSLGHKDLVAHGLLTAAFFSAMSGTHLPGDKSMCLSVEFQFPNPVYPGDELEYTAEVVKVSDEYQVVDLDVSCRNQEGTKVLRGKMRVHTKNQTENPS